MSPLEHSSYLDPPQAVYVPPSTLLATLAVTGTTVHCKAISAAITVHPAGTPSLAYTLLATGLNHPIGSNLCNDNTSRILSGRTLSANVHLPPGTVPNMTLLIVPIKFPCTLEDSLETFPSYNYNTRKATMYFLYNRGALYPSHTGNAIHTTTGFGNHTMNGNNNFHDRSTSYCFPNPTNGYVRRLEIGTAYFIYNRNPPAPTAPASKVKTKGGGGCKRHAGHLTIYPS